MARPKSKDKSDVVLSLKISEKLKDSMSVLAELRGLEISGYVRQVLRSHADKNAELIKKAIDLKQKYADEKVKLIAQDSPADETQDLKGGDVSDE